MAWGKTSQEATTYLDWGVVPVSGTGARTTMVMFKTSYTGSTLRMGGWGTGGSAGARWAWRLDDTASYVFRVEVESGYYSGDTTGLNDGNWHCVIFGVAASANITAMKMCIDGEIEGSAGSVSRTVDTGTTDTLTLGYDPTQSNDGPVCDYAEIATWNRLLSNQEMIGLSGGTNFTSSRASPLFSTNGLVLYSDLIGNYREVIAKNEPTESGANGGFVAHTNVIQPSAQILQFPPAAAAGFEPQWARHSNIILGSH